MYLISFSASQAEILIFLCVQNSEAEENLIFSAGFGCFDLSVSVHMENSIQQTWTVL